MLGCFLFGDRGGSGIADGEASLELERHVTGILANGAAVQVHSDRELDDATATLANMLQDELNEMSDPAAAAAEVKRLMAAPGRAVSTIQPMVMVAGWRFWLTLRRPLLHSRCSCLQGS
mgnify:CR=1 FL=1